MQQTQVHDVVEVCEKVCVWGNILSPLHDPADQLVGMKLPLLVTLHQHGGLGKREYQIKSKSNCNIMNIRGPIVITHTNLKKPGREDSQGWDKNRRRG